MAEEQLTRNRQLLAMKGVASEDEEPKPKVDSEKVLTLYQQKKIDEQNPDKFDKLHVEWNVDGTLNRLTARRNGEVIYELNFIWNQNGSISEIMRR